MNLRHLKIDALTALGNQIQLKDIRPIYEEWKDNRPVGEPIKHIYTIISEEIAYENALITIEGKNLIEKYDGLPFVEFQELKLRIDKNNNLVGSAKGIAIKGKTTDKSLKIND